MKNSILQRLKPELKSPWLAGQLTIWFLVCVFSFFVAILLTYTSLQPDSLSGITYLLNGVALFAGGFSAGKISGKKGWYYGGVQGIIYSTILMMISFLGFNESISASSILLISLSFLTSALGGIIGVNRRK